MTPQYSFPPGRAFPWGMTAKVYLRMECYRMYINATYRSIYNAINSGFRYGYSLVIRLVRYCFHCSQKWFIYLGHHSVWVSVSFLWQQLAQAVARHLLDPPGDPPWCKFTNHLKTKNRPFINPSSWTVPETWRSPERN